MEEKKEASLNVYQAINKIQHDISSIGISKDQKNEHQGYKFRGIDDIYNTLCPLMAKYGLCLLPNVLERECVERHKPNGAMLFWVTLKVAFDFVSAHDGTTHKIVVHGEAMDSGDKATNKALSAAYKYACIQTFCIPTEGDNDADASTHEVAPMNTANDVKKYQVSIVPTDPWEYVDAFQELFDRSKVLPHLANIKRANSRLLKNINEAHPEVHQKIMEAMSEAGNRLS